MLYVYQMAEIAEYFGEKISLEWNKKTYLFTISINNVFLKDHYLMQKISGNGFTLDDACYDYVRKARCFKLNHALSNKEKDII